MKLPSAKRLMVLALMIGLLSGCGSSGTSSVYSSSSSDSPSGTSSSSQAVSYDKDGEGFYILEDDYFSYNDDPLDAGERSKLFIAEPIDGMDRYSQIRLFGAGTQIPVYNCKTNISQTWNGDAPSRMNNAVTSIGLKGRITLRLQCNFKLFGECVIRPLQRNVLPEVDEERRVVTFTIEQVGQYTIELRSDRCLHLFVDELPSDEEYDQSAKYYFAPGIHDSTNDKRISADGTIELSSGSKVYLAPGSVVRGKFLANNKNDVSIHGLGYIDGSQFARSATTGEATIPIDFNHCTNVSFSDFACLDPAGWCFNLYFCTNVTLANVKIITSRSNGDGISVQSCQEVEVEGCFVRTWDDSLVVKNYPEWSNKSIEGTTRNVHFRNCLLWTDLAQSMEVGYECVGQVMEGISFIDIVVLHNYHKAVISIHNGNNADLKDVSFTNVTIEDASMGKGDGNGRLVDISVMFSSTWSTKHKETGLGSIDGITISNIDVRDGIENPAIMFRGSMESRDGYPNVAHYVANVTVAGFSLYGTVIDENYAKLTQEYVKDLSFEDYTGEIDGASLPSIDVSSFGSNIDLVTL